MLIVAILPRAEERFAKRLFCRFRFALYGVPVSFEASSRIPARNSCGPPVISSGVGLDASFAVQRNLVPERREPVRHRTIFAFAATRTACDLSRNSSTSKAFNFGRQVNSGRLAVAAALRISRVISSSALCRAGIRNTAVNEPPIGSQPSFDPRSSFQPWQMRKHPKAAIAPIGVSACSPVNSMSFIAFPFMARNHAVGAAQDGFKKRYSPPAVFFSKSRITVGPTGTQLPNSMGILNDQPAPTEFRGDGISVVVPNWRERSPIAMVSADQVKGEIFVAAHRPFSGLLGKLNRRELVPGTPGKARKVSAPPVFRHRDESALRQGLGQ